MYIKRLLLIGLMFLLVYPVNGQETRVKATRVVPLYCYTDLLRGYDSSCVNRVRITFRNSDEMIVRNIYFQLKISDTKGGEDSVLYDAKHSVTMLMKTNETFNADVALLNSISPPEGENSFINKKSWKWEVTILSLNRK